ncbi:MAG: transcriptional regulator [Nitrosopumilaceae archaeon]|nr:transcriptional regulator [Nitrosopumilaceae archaeon]NIP10263.1 transcriptional regulator [Nitrosopumilaceae archaeon]NIS94406.1 transcriptional regulator [Nitrosopumilaceae archaeon]
MPGIDLLISRYFSDEIKNNLEPKIKSQVERDLFFQNGMSIKLAIEHFDAFQSVLKNYYKNNISELEKTCFDKIFTLDKSGDKYILKINNHELADKIFDYYGDPESRKILSCIMGKKLTISEILSESKVLKSPAYRKIENLHLDGLILESGKILTKNKRVSQYSCIFDNVQIFLNRKTLEVKCIISRKNLESSSVYQHGLI